LAAPATANYLRQAEAKAQVEAKQQAKLDAQASETLKKLEDKAITIAVRVGEQGRLYGSVTSQDIAEEASKLANSEIDHRQVQLAEPIREIGEYNVEIRLTRNVGMSLPVTVVSIEQEQASE
jgi:large subunit ribosomal protein L9